MNEVLINGKRFVVSRQRGALSELVDEEGRILRIPTSEVPIPTYIWRGVVPGSVRFSERPRDFLSKLRSRRDIDLAARLKAKRSAKPKTPRDPSQSKKTSKVSTVLNAAMNALSPEIAAMMAQQLAGLNSRKPSGKKK